MRGRGGSHLSFGGKASESSAASLTGGRLSQTGATGRTSLNTTVNLKTHPAESGRIAAA